MKFKLRCRSFNRELFCLVIAAGCVAKSGAAAENSAIAFQKGVGQMAITIDGKPFGTYVWSDPKTTRPYFKQVYALGGKTQITRKHPPGPDDFSDHETYHPGIWWGFGDVHGNDYWRLKAKVVGGSFVQEPVGGSDSGSFAVHNKMLIRDSERILCSQICRYNILRKTSGILMICESTLQRSGSDFWLGDQEEMGLAIRVATPIATKSGKGGLICDSEGRTERNQLRTNQSDWCDYSGPINGKYGGMMLMNDPENFRKPWWHAVDTGLLVANPLGQSELNGQGKKRENVLVEKGRPFRLRYGVLIHLHNTREQFNAAQEYDEFVRTLRSFD